MDVVDVRQSRMRSDPTPARSQWSSLDVSPSRILTVAEVALDLRSSKAHVCNIVAGKVKGVAPLAVLRLGRRILIRRSTLEEWKLANERATASGILGPSPEVDAVDA
jgi:hypothetical protein